MSLAKNEWPCKLLWRKSFLPKDGVFAWLEKQGNVLTQDRLAKTGYQGASRCVMCKGNVELVDHLLLNCQYSSKCLNSILEKLEFYSPKPQYLL